MCIDTEEEEEDCQKEFLEKILEKNLKTTDDFLGERHFKNFFNDSHSTKYEHSHYKQTNSHSFNRAFVTEVIVVVVGFVFVVVVADIYAIKTR